MNTDFDKQAFKEKLRTVGLNEEESFCDAIIISAFALLPSVVANIRTHEPAPEDVHRHLRTALALAIVAAQDPFATLAPMKRQENYPDLVAGFINMIVPYLSESMESDPDCQNALRILTAAAKIKQLGHDPFRMTTPVAFMLLTEEVPEKTILH